jgi:hypothetical protein
MSSQRDGGTYMWVSSTLLFFFFPSSFPPPAACPPAAATAALDLGLPPPSSCAARFSPEPPALSPTGPAAAGVKTPCIGALAGLVGRLLAPPPALVPLVTPSDDEEDDEPTTTAAGLACEIEGDGEAVGGTEDDEEKEEDG